MCGKVSRHVLNFFSSGEKMATKKKVSQKHKTDEESKKLCEKAIEAEKNFQNAVDMADGFPPPKSEEDFKFLEKWLFL